MQHAKTSIDQIPGVPKFKLLRRSKAEVATWLAWQSEPDHGLWQAAKLDLLNEAAPQLQALKTWLMRLFPASDIPF
jgi:heme-degrading monooxygenase HmoA